MPTSTSDYSFGQAAGQSTLRFNDHRFTLKGDSICAELSAIKAVGVKRLDEVASHTINDIVGSRSHVIHFVNGAVLQYAYNSAGQLIELSGQNLACNLSHDNELVFYIR